MIKNIIFDWSGVINDNFAVGAATINKVLNHCGARSLSDDEIKREWCQPYMKFYNKFIPDLSLEEEKDLFLQYSKDNNGGELRQGMLEILKELKQRGIRMIVISADPTGHAWRS